MASHLHKSVPSFRSSVVGNNRLDYVCFCSNVSVSRISVSGAEIKVAGVQADVHLSRRFVVAVSSFRARWTSHFAVINRRFAITFSFCRRRLPICADPSPGPSEHGLRGFCFRHHRPLPSPPKTKMQFVGAWSLWSRRAIATVRRSRSVVVRSRRRVNNSLRTGLRHASQTSHYCIFARLTTSPRRLRH